MVKRKHRVGIEYWFGGTLHSLAQFLKVKQRQRGRITPSRLYASANAFDAVRNTLVLRQATVCKACVKEKEWVSVNLCKPQERVLAININARQSRANLWVKSFSKITEMGKMPRVWIERGWVCFLSKFTFSLPLSYYHRWKSQFKKSDRCVWCMCVCPQGGRG